MRSFPTLSLIPMILACGGLSALDAQTVSTDQSKLTFFSQVGGSAQSQVLNVNSNGGAAFFVVSSNATWLKVNSQNFTSGTTPSAVTVSADPSGLAAGVYNGTLAVTGGTSSVPSVAVTLTVSTIGISPQSISFNFTAGGVLPASQSLTLTGPTTAFTATSSTQSGGMWFGLLGNNGLTTTLAGQSPGALVVGANANIVPSLAAGTYNGAITITPTTGSTTAPLTVNVVLTVTAAPPVSVNPASLVFNIQVGGTNNIVTQPITIATSVGTALNFTLGASVTPNPAGKNWIVLGQSSGVTATNTGTATLNIGVDFTNLPAGSYSGNVRVSTAFSNDAADIPITLLISNSPLLNVPTAALNFTFQLGGNAPASQTVTVTATSGTIPYTIVDPNARPWLTIPSTGTTPTPFTVAINPAGLTGLTPGTYSTTLNITGSGVANGVQQVPVVLKITNDPTIVSNVSALSFPYQINKAQPAPATVTLTSSTGLTLNYTATAATTACGNTWLLLNGTANGTANGTTQGSFSVGINTAGLASGTCTGNISVVATKLDGTAVINSPIAIAVTLIVSNTPLILASPAPPLVFTAQQGGQSPVAQSIGLSTTSATDQVSYNATFATNNGGSWLPVGTTISGMTPANVLVPVSSSLLSAGSYTGTVTIVATGPANATVANSPLTYPVNLTVTSGNLTVGATALNFSYTSGGTVPAAQTVTVGSTGATLNYTASTSSSGNWLSVTPNSGTTANNPSISVSVDGSHLTPGPYVGTITIAAPGAGNSPQTITVNFTVSPPTISAPTATLAFTQVAGGTAPAAQTFTVSSSPASGVAFTVAGSVSSGSTNWLTVSPASSTTPGVVTVSVSGTGLTPGVYNGQVTITASATGSPINVPVQFTVLSAQSLTATPTLLNFSYTTSLAAPQGQTLQVSASTSGTPFTVTAQIASGPAGWLIVTPTSGSTPSTLTVGIVTTGLTAGSYSGSITINSPNALNPTVVPVNLTVIVVPIPVINAIGNAASYSRAGVSPGENIVIFGTGIGPTTLAGLSVANNTVTTVAGNTRVLFDGVPAPVIYASSVQTSVMVPYGVAGRTSTNIQVEYLGVQSVAISQAVAPAAPGIYSLNLSGTGPGATLNQDFTVNGPGSPAPIGSVVSIYMTGEGQTTPVGVDGAVIPPDGSGLKRPILPVTASVGGVPATIFYAGSANGLVSGVFQVNLQIPAGVASGTQPLVVAVGNTPSQAGITISVK